MSNLLGPDGLPYVETPAQYPDALKGVCFEQRIAYQLPPGCDPPTPIPMWGVEVKSYAIGADRPQYTVSLGWEKIDRDPYYVEFTLYEIAGHGDDGPLYTRSDASKTATGRTDSTTVLADAEELARGSVKWDGCMNWKLGGGAVMLHHCGRQDFEDLLTALAQVRCDCAAKMALGAEEYGA